ncbi:MAG: DNA polymerase III subunit gamma/tau [Gammaproteobacteria bacterium]
MSYTVLARQWRPGKFSEMIGQTHVLQALINALDNDRLHHAYLFTGTRGVGKTTVARIFAKSLNCESGVSAEPCGQCSACTEIDEGRFVDLIEVDAASRTKVEDTRELLDNVQYQPTRGRYKVYLIDEVHMLSTHSFNALLKTLEEPPPHVKFLLATTDPHKLLPTVLSRCLQFNLKRLSRAEISGYLEKVLGEEKIEFEAPAIQLLAKAADGSMRDALSLLDQAIAFGGGAVAEATVRTMLGSIEQSKVVAVLDALANQDAPALMESVGDVAEHLGDFAGLLADVLTMLQRIAIAQAIPDKVDSEMDEREAILDLAGRMSSEDVQLYYQTGLIGRRDLSLSPDARGGLEMVLLRMLAFRPAAVSARPVKKVALQASTPQASTPGSVKKTMPAKKLQPVSAATASDTDGWHALLDQLKLSGMLRELAMNCACQSKNDDQWKLLLAKSHAQLFSSERQKRLQTMVSDALGRPVQLNIEVLDNSVDSPAAKHRQEVDARQAQAVAEIQQDPNVQAIKEVFGATVHENSIRPVD